MLATGEDGNERGITETCVMPEMGEKPETPETVATVATVAATATAATAAMAAMTEMAAMAAMAAMVVMAETVGTLGTAGSERRETGETGEMAAMGGEKCGGRASAGDDPWPALLACACAARWPRVQRKHLVQLRRKLNLMSLGPRQKGTASRLCGSSQMSRFNSQHRKKCSLSEEQLAERT